MKITAIMLGTLITCAGLAGCSKPQAQADSATATHPYYVAVARGRVAVEGGLLTLTAPTQGTVASVRVHEGERIPKDAILATLDAAQARNTLTAAHAKLAIARAKAQLLDAQLAAARQLAQREVAAAKAGAGTRQSADSATTAVAQLKARREAAEAEITLAQSDVASAQVDLSRHTLHSPVDAYVVHVLTQPGASVSPQTHVFILLPKRPLIVRAKLNATYLHAVHPGMHATISADGSPNGDTIPAHVVRIGRVFGPNSLEDNPGQVASTRAVTCVLAFDKAPATRVGQRVLVRFLPDPHTTKD